MHGEDPKYYSIKMQENAGFFGLNRLDYSKQVYVVEGQIDSLFLPNCVAVGTSALWKYGVTGDEIYIPDVDVRNVQIMKIVWTMIKSNLRVCLLPPGQKDLNLMILAGMSQDDLIQLVNSHTYQGPAAQFMFSRWSKIKVSNLEER